MVFKNTRELEEGIRTAVLGAIQRTGYDIFYQSQETQDCYVPVLTGKLKISGYVNNTQRGVAFGYNVPYASRVEAGGPAIPIEGDQLVWVPPSTRKGKRVKGYWQNLKGKKKITFSPKIDKFTRGEPITRTMSEIPAQEGQFYLGRAVDEKMPNIVSNLRNTFKYFEMRGN